MEVLELISDCVPYVLSIIATIVAFKKQKKQLTAEEIEAKAEAKKQKTILKLNKKNHISSQPKVAVEVVEVPAEDNSTGYTTL